MCLLPGAFLGYGPTALTPRKSPAQGSGHPAVAMVKGTSVAARQEARTFIQSVPSWLLCARYPARQKQGSQEGRPRSQGGRWGLGPGRMSV